MRNRRVKELEKNENVLKERERESERKKERKRGKEGGKEKNKYRIILVYRLVARFGKFVNINNFNLQLQGTNSCKLNL